MNDLQRIKNILPGIIQSSAKDVPKEDGPLTKALEEKKLEMS